MKPATRLTFSEVVNGSATPKVISLRWCGRQRVDQHAQDPRVEM